MVKIEQTGGRLTEEEILHKEDKLKYVQNRLTKINAELDMEPKTEPKLVKKEELKKCL